MAVYVILDVDVKDWDVYKEYQQQGGPTIVAHGGKPLTRGGETFILEGAWQPKRMIMLEFDNTKAALGWYNSSEYTKARELRHKCSQTNAVIVQGF